MNEPIWRMRPGFLSMNGGMNGSSRACHLPPFMKKPPILKERSIIFVPSVRREQPRLSKRYASFSSLTSIALGISLARSRSGNDALMAAPFVTMPETPNPGSSARS